MSDTNAIEQQMLHGLRADNEDDAREHRTDSEAETESNDEDAIDDDDDERYTSDRYQPKMMDHSSLGPQAGYNTGVKGVRSDAKRHEEVQRALRADQVRAKNERMESMALGKSRTWEEEEADRRNEAEQGLKPGQAASRSGKDCGDDDDEELEVIRQRRLGTLKSQAASNEARRRKMAGEEESDQSTGAGGMFGHLREVGADSYANAIDTEDKNTFVVVHIYVKVSCICLQNKGTRSHSLFLYSSQYVHACAQLTSVLSSLARMHTQVKFIQVRAGAIGFGSGGKEVGDEVEGDEAAEEVVPTMLVYKGGQLIANLVRVDLEEEWKEGQERNIRDLLVA